MIQCLYKCDTGFPSTQEYHIYPISASTLDLRLEKGIVCDRCNSYFSNLEQYFTHRHPFTSSRLTSLEKTHKRKTPKLFLKNGRTATREDRNGKHHFTFPVNHDIRLQEEKNGDLIFVAEYEPQSYDAVKISRLLCKMGLETLFNGQTELNPYNEAFDPLRRYARFGPNKFLKYVWFAWKKTESVSSPPQIVQVTDGSGTPLTWLARLYFPKGTYLIPLIPSHPIRLSDSAQKEWRVIDRPGIVKNEKEKVELTLKKVHSPPPCSPNPDLKTEK
jgi:hypothetical protein